jgi:NAD(P)-dependent dehydrogenase (short-subunit alcohol dehydrogenase family)
MSCKGKIVAVTGAAGGIGQSVCRYFAGEGAAIAATDKNMRGGALRDEFAYFATCALNGETPNVGVRTMPPPLSKRRWRLRNRRAPAM